jgi:hypothetical protein
MIKPVGRDLNLNFKLQSGLVSKGRIGVMKKRSLLKSVLACLVVLLAFGFVMTCYELFLNGGPWYVMKDYWGNRIVMGQNSQATVLLKNEEGEVTGKATVRAFKNQPENALIEAGNEKYRWEKPPYVPVLIVIIDYASYPFTVLPRLLFEVFGFDAMRKPLELPDVIYLD